MGNLSFLTVDGDGSFSFRTAAKNTLEADRLRFQIKASGAVQLNAVHVFHSGTTDDTRLEYNNTNFVLLDNNWLTIDLPFATGTKDKGTSIFQSGTRYNVDVTSGDDFTYELDF